MPAPITGAMLYDVVHCPHRVYLDLYGDQNRRDKVSPFVQLLWERGHAFEKEVVASLKQPLIDLSLTPADERERLTIEAMVRAEPLIYGGRISSGDLLGEPDLLKREGQGYIAGDIKSGAGEEGGDDDEEGRPKKHYAVQLALYTEILERLGWSAGKRAFIWDIHGKEVIYDFTEAHGIRNPRTLWAEYQDALGETRAITAGAVTLPAHASACKNCVWHTACVEELDKSDDLSLIHELGRSKRDAMIRDVPTVKEFAETEAAAFVDGKKTRWKGIGIPTLEKLHRRARLLCSEGAEPVLRAPLGLPVTDQEIFFDIEVDPMRDVCYLHGFVTRDSGDNSTEKFVYFFADEPTPEHEEKAFAGAWNFMTSAPRAAIYYYSKYERTIYRKLQAKYPTVCTPEAIEALFAPSRAIDLYYDVVLKATDWPTRDYSIKTLAKYLGFRWRDTHPSGAASIEWFHRWVETGDRAIKQRILDYNEDDCRATRILLDGIRALACN